MIRQNPLTLITPVPPDQVSGLATLLARLRQDMESGIAQPFEKLGTIHYARWILLDPKDIEFDYPVSPGIRLVFSSDFDGQPDEHIRDLAVHCGPFLDNMYSCCADYPVDRNPQSRAAYLRRWMAPSSAFFAGAPGRTLKQIRLESSLRDYIWKFLAAGNWKGKTPSEVTETIRSEIRGRQEFYWAEEKTRLPSVNPFGLALMGLVIPLLFPIILVWILVIRIFHEGRDKELGLSPSQVDEEHIHTLEEYEDLQNQNQFTQVLVMKPGPVRLIALQSMMLFARVLIANAFVKGKLMGIPTIHFARWLMIDNKKVMVFFSNFDGSWQQYLGDFIDKSGWGLTGIWSNTIKFPKTRFLFWGGAYDEEHFLAWSRYYQIPTQAWYCAYPRLSIKNIINNSEIRKQLQRPMNDRQAQRFLNRF